MGEPPVSPAEDRLLGDRGGLPGRLCPGKDVFSVIVHARPLQASGEIPKKGVVSVIVRIAPGPFANWDPGQNLVFPVTLFLQALVSDGYPILGNQALPSAITLKTLFCLVFWAFWSAPCRRLEESPKRRAFRLSSKDAFCLFHRFERGGCKGRATY